MKHLLPFLSVTISLSVITTLITSCRQVVAPAHTSVSETSSYVYRASEPSAQSEAQSDGTTDISETVTQNGDGTLTVPAALPSTAAETKTHTTEPRTETPSERKTETPSAATEPTTAKGQKTDSAEVDLSIELPSANGKMEVDTSRGNKFTVIVSEERGIDASYLAAVYSVPDSGQNYVFEFSSKTGRTADDLRRVYLIDANGKITGVAAKKASEKENISAVENWFCINVIIKNLIFPSVEDELNG